MQGKHPTPPDSASPSPQSTAAGLEAWLAGANAEAIREGTGTLSAGHPPATASEPTDAIGPVNAAEALALRRIGTAHRLTGPDGAELVIDPDADAYYFESTALVPLNVLLQQPADAWTPVYSRSIEAARAAAGAPQALARLRWYAGLIATPGILSRRLNRADRYELTSWPETEREFPQYFRIAREMLKGAMTVHEVVAASGAAYEEVVDFINACFAAGRIETAPGADAKPPQLSRRQRLLAILNKPLFGR